MANEGKGVMFSRGCGFLVVALLMGTSVAAQESSVSCDGRWRGIAYEKVKAGDEHCGLLERGQKADRLAMACRLADGHREELRERAEQRAWSRVENLGKLESCSCSGNRRSWENVFTHVFSQRCWTECGEAFVIECQPLEASEEVTPVRQAEETPR